MPPRIGLSAFLGWILDAVRLNNLLEDLRESALRRAIEFLFGVDLGVVFDSF